MDYLGIRYSLPDGTISMANFLGRKIPCFIWTIKRVTNELFWAINQCLAEYRAMSYGQPVPFPYAQNPNPADNPDQTHQ